MGVVSTPPLPPAIPPPPPPPASPERLMLTRDPSRPFFCGMNGSTSAESFTSCTKTNEQPLLSHCEQEQPINDYMVHLSEKEVYAFEQRPIS